jgi:hypothetical protein
LMNVQTTRVLKTEVGLKLGIDRLMRMQTELMMIC